MGRKKRYIVNLKPFCYYCDKEFNNEVILHQHQKAKHFSCKECKNRFFSTAPAIETHMLQYHHKKINSVPQAKAGRNSFEISIYGMDGVPMDLIHEKLEDKVDHKRKRLTKKGLIKIDVLTPRRIEKSDKEIFFRNSDAVNLTKSHTQVQNAFGIMPMMPPPMFMPGFQPPQNIQMPPMGIPSTNSLNIN